MSTDVFTGGGATTAQDTDQKARAAVRAFRHLQPTLSSYARILTGKPNVRVEISGTSNGMTDGSRIFFRPPLALGDNTPHNRRLCDKRNDSWQQLCPACRVREMVLITIYHEIGHIAHDSFAKTTDYDRAHLVVNALEQVDKKFAHAVKQRIEMAPSYAKDSYMSMAGLISPFLPGIVNALDDARVNSRVMDARQGTKAMFKAFVYRVFEEGVEQKGLDGQFILMHWRDYPLNMQAVAGILCTVSGYDIGEWLVPEVVAAMQDEQVQDILRVFPTVRNVSGIYAMSIPLLVRLRELGFFKADTDPVTEEEEHGDDEGSEESPSPATDGSDTGDEAGDSDSPSDPGQEQGDEGETEGDSPVQPTEEGDGSGSSDADSDGQGEPRLDEKPDTTDADLGEPDSSEGSGDEAEASSDGSEGSADDGTPSDESGSGSSEDDRDARDDSDQQDASEGDGPVDETEQGDGGSEASEERSAGGAGAEEDGDDPEERLDDVEGASDDASGAGGDHDSSEAGSDAQGLDDEEVLGEPSDLREPDAVPRDDLDGDAGTGTGDATPGEADDDVPSDVLDEREDSEDGSSGHDPAREEDSEPIDTGADEGLGGIEVIEDSAFDRLPMGSPEDVEKAIHEIAHPEDRPESVKEGNDSAEEIERAVMQGIYFETPSRRVFGVREHYWDQPVIIDGYNMSQGWDQGGRFSIGYTPEALGIEGDFTCSEKILGPALLRMRVAFSDNKRGHDERNKKSGKVDGRVLGKRAHHGDERLFKRRTLPGKKDYFVLIGIDISGSTIGKNIALAKQAAMGQATLCHRMGIKFAVFAHSGKMHDPRAGRAHGVDVDIYHLKDPDEPWTEEVQKRLLDIGPDSANLDGHTFEYYRKVLDKRSETHKVMLYYTDGKMPAENHDEELEVLRREIKVCRNKKYVLLGVGIRTDSPIRHGLDTVRVDGEEDIVKVVKHLEKRLLAI